MSSIKTLLILALFAMSTACGGAFESRQLSAPEGRSESLQPGDSKSAGGPEIQKVSLSQADQSQTIAEAMNRKIIRNAEFQLEVTNPADAQRRITSIAETLGGFVVTSESKQRDTGDPAKPELEATLVVRVPALQFNSAMEQIRAVANQVVHEKATGQDVTEDFIDLEARIKTQKALELQFLEIMKQANKVTDALEVQRQIAEVRNDIEKLEGRKRFLENRASLSTITINLKTPAAIAVNTSSFGRSVREAASDSISIVSGILIFLIRFVIVAAPVLLLIIVPGGLLARFIFQRAKRWHPAQAAPTPNSE